MRTASPLAPKYKIEPTAKGSADAGRVLFDSLGCLACHQNLNDPTGAKRDNQLVTRGEQWIVNDLVKSGKLAQKLLAETGKEPDSKTLTTEALKLYDGMTYNERQLYVLENLEQLPGATDVPKYPDNTPKPIFMHHGPELSGIGTKLLSGRSREQAVEWLYNWLKEPRHYSEYTVMPQLRLSDQQAIDLVEYLLAQTREANKPGDTWKAELTPVDSPKLIELTSLFLRARFSVQKSRRKGRRRQGTDRAGDRCTDNTPSAGGPGQGDRREAEQGRQATGLPRQEADRALRLHELPCDQRRRDHHQPVRQPFRLGTETRQ